MKQIELKFNVTGLHKLPPRLAKPLIYTIRDRAFDFRGVCEVGRRGGGRWEAFFSSRFSSDRKPEIFFFFFTVWVPKYFFQDKAKTKYFFFLNSIYVRNVFFQIYTFVYILNPIYMGICTWVYCLYVRFGSEDVDSILKLFLISVV